MSRDSSFPPPARPSAPVSSVSSVRAPLSLLAALGDTFAATSVDQRLIDAFDAAVAGGRSDGFLRQFDTLLERSHACADLSAAFRALGELHRHADRVGEAGARDRSRLFDDIAAIVAQTAERLQVGQRYRAEERILRLVRANEALSPALDLPSVQTVLAQTLQQFGINRCFVCVLEGQAVPAEWARLVIAHDRTRSISLPEGGLRFAARDLLPLDLLTSDERTTWLVCPMLRRDPSIPGYVVFERSLHDAYVYDGLLDQIGTAYKRVELLQRVVEEAKLREIAERERIEREMQIAAAIQTGILPYTRHVDGLEFSAAMIPATEVGGDYYDIVPVRSGCWIGIGDVAGHGLPTGLVMLMLQSAVSGLVRQNPDASPRDVLLVVNEFLFDNIRRRMHQDEHVTLLLLRYRSDGTLVFAGAHEDFLVYRAKSGTVDRVTSQGAWVGVLPDIRSLTEDGFCLLEEDDLLVLYTDGITEALNEHKEMYGVERLASALERLHAESVDSIRKGILEEVRAWTAVQRDDVTLLVARQGRRFTKDPD
jgi:serine phosphatase RsbU (regulator of sigma subunit)